MSARANWDPARSAGGGRQSTNHPGVSRRRAALTVIVGLAGAGAVVGALWAWLAPPIHGVVALTRSGDRVKAYLGNESDHWFTSAFLVVGLLSVLAVIAAVLVWQWRTHRGPAVLAALVVGGVCAAGAAVGVGAALARWRYGVVDVAAAPVSEQHRVHYVTEAPSAFFGHSPLQIVLTLLFPAAVAAVVYLLAAVSAQRDDLGAWPPVESPVPVTDRSGTEVPVPPVAPSPPSP
ncbi:Protein of unknown function (DUF2567) [Mycolicibacterium chubuense NBB4]|uniref:DUF2567 domain-containing protein n=1 Tax=Mycolicibacterium chubuense (strain NBB4) TaxID=710421 RepID=I4BJ34_MYCCN|nr:DUF2567 domain-containing protein [Mycolicibacterium chubuense]AFM17291.1 Protein of unknown function (DUF2567) [Mycolicibacterium chubuense NBB4]